MSCSSSVSDENLIHLYVKLNVARERFITSDSLYNIEKQNLFSEYKTNEEDFNKAIIDIKYDDKRWDKFFNSALAYVDTLKNRDTTYTKK